MNKSCIVNGCECENFYKYPERCNTCFDQSFFIPRKLKKTSQPRQYKKSQRMGAKFEESLNQKLNKLVEASSSLTPNSGAGKVKGDIEIKGLINIKGELKTKVIPKISRGSLSFTIQKEWLDKIIREYKEADMDFGFLAFKFLETDKDTYIVINEEEYESWIATIVADRRKSILAAAEVDMYKTKARASETKLIAAQAEIEALKAEIEFYKKEKENDVHC